MALNLSTLTSPATSDDVLAEVLTTADFLEPVPVLRNLARGSNKGGDAEQAVALNQPKALPLIDGEGYLYLSGVIGNYASFGEAILPNNTNFDVSVDFYYGGPSGPSYDVLFEQYLAGDFNRFFIYIRANRTLGIFWAGFSDSSLTVTEGRHTVRFVKSGSTITVYLDGVQGNSLTRSTDITQNTITSIGSASGFSGLKGAVFSAVEANGLFNVDFTSTNVRHNDTKFQCATGQTVTINQSGNDPATIIKKPVLRFANQSDNTTAICLQGLLNQTITDGYMFAAFSVLGDGGEVNARIFGMNQTGFNDTFAGGFFFGRADTSVEFGTRYNGSPRSDVHLGLFSKNVGDILLESDFVDGSQTSKINNADEDNGANTTIAGDLSAEEFKIASYTTGDNNSALDLEYLALFPADSVPDEATASRIRNYINNRNNVFYRWDTDGYYFYNPQDLSSGAVTTWNGRIVGSDNGDADKNATQATSADQPTSDGYKVTFADNTDHFDIPSTTQAGWQVVGTSLGTFAYKVDSDAVTELNLLGNLGNASYRKAGDLYGIILLPESATGREIEQARELLIDRGASDGVTVTDLQDYFRNRRDIVEFKSIDTSQVTSFFRTWNGADSLTSFPLIDTSSALIMRQSFQSAANLSSFPAIQAPNCSDFRNTWQNCSALTSFPEDAKLGTEASNVNFQSAWQASGLTSFNTPLPTAMSASSAWLGCSSLTSFDTPLPSATSLASAWRGCSSLTSFDTPLPSATNLASAFQDCTQLAEIGQLQTSNVTTWYYSFYNCRSLLSFPVLDTSSGTDFFGTWRNCSGLTQFPLLDCNLGRRFAWTWQGCSSLEDFPAGFFDNWNPLSISNEVFQNTWDGCTALTAQSVENILTSIDASGKWATSDGTSGGTALADAGIDIDYDVSTGSLSAATNAAIRSLDTKGWEVYINGEIRTGVELLDLQGFYFFESEGLAAANVTSWDSSIGASSASLDLVGTQTDANDQPVADGTVVTFADNTDHIDITSTTQAGWQVVGTSLGTFAYKVNTDAVTELNLLGNLGSAGHRKAGDLYGIILLPESATGRQINEAKKLLTDRGASVSATANFQQGWRNRADIVQFDGGDMSGVTNAYRAWRICTSLTSFDTPLPSVTDAGYAWQNCASLESFSSDLSSVTDARYAWNGCSSLSDFRTTDIKNCSNFYSAWENCSSLTSFPQDAKLGTEVSTAGFTRAWQGSGLTSFITPLPTANSVISAWRYCNSLESFSTPLPLVTSSYQAWYNCFSLTDFSADVFSNWNPSSISSGVFNLTWFGCTSLTAQSVENILTSIDSSGKWATSDGTSGGTALADAGIDIDYNGDPLSAATTAAIDSLSGKGWQVYINGELVIPNILDLQPAAAYSLRSFDADADPNVVNVRRSSDGATSDFTASEVSDGTLVAWVGAGNDGHVTTWYDQSGANHATQTTASRQPKIVDAGTLVTEGGLAAIDFAGTHDSLSYGGLALTNIDEFSIFQVVSFTGYGLSKASFGLSDGTNTPNGGSFFTLYPADTTNGNGVRDFIGSICIDENDATRTGQILLSYLQDSIASREAFVNGSSVGTNTLSKSIATASHLYIGTNDAIQPYAGKIQKTIFFNTDQSSNRTGIEKNINDHFDIYS